MGDQAEPNSKKEASEMMSLLVIVLGVFLTGACFVVLGVLCLLYSEHLSRKEKE